MNGLSYERKAVAAAMMQVPVLVVSSLGLEPRALALKGLIRLLGLKVMEND